MTLPLIGITTWRTLSNYGQPRLAVAEAYVQAIHQAGACPVLLPMGLPEEVLQALLSRLDGLLFTGGGDIHPERFGGDPRSQAYEVDPDRDRVEFYLLEKAIQEEMPFLGICRGLQVVNVGLGGTLYTDIATDVPQALKHDYYPAWPRHHLAHPVQVDGDSRLAGTLGKRHLPVNSLHHQAIQQLASGLVATAHSPDGLVEAVELPGHPFGLAVQWHPECLGDDPPMQRLFRSFVEAALSKGDRG